MNSSKKVAIFNSEIFWNTHLGTGLEIMQRHLDQGDEIIAFVCNDFFTYCDQNLKASPDICKICVNKRTKSFSWLKGNVREIPIHFDKKNYGYASANMNLKAFMEIKHNGYDVGMAVASSVISRRRDANLNVKENFDIMLPLMNNAASLYDFFITQLQIEKPERVYIFNGRFDYDRALLRACEKLKIDYYIFDGAGPLEKFMLIKNAMIHDIQNFKTRALEYWDNSQLSDDEKRNIGVEFYEERRYGSNTSRLYFVKDQDPTLLPLSWDDKYVNIPVYLSSEDEFVAIGDQWKMVAYENQIDGLTKIASAIKQSRKNIRLYIRIHPNTYNTSPEFVAKIMDIQNDNIEVIPPNSPVSSYRLLMESQKIITFGSTMGIEATFWKKPSINLGNSLYMNLGVTYNCKSHEEAISYIFDEGLKAIESDNVYKYGFYNRHFGEFYKYYQPINNSNGNYMGKNLGLLNLPPFVRARQLVKAMMPNVFIVFYNTIREKF